FFAALIAGGLMGLLHVLLTQRFRLNHVISGVAINILALASTTFILRRVFNTAGREANVASTIPIAAFIILALALPFVLQFVLEKTRFGLRLRAVGENPESARMAGVSPMPLRIACVCL